MPLWSFSVIWNIRHIEGTARPPHPPTGVLFCRSVHQPLRGAPLVGFYSCGSAHQSHKGTPWVGSYSSSVHQASLSIGQLPMLVCGGTEAIVMASPGMHDSAVSPCFHGFLAFLHRHFPPQSPPSYPLNLSLSLQSRAALPLGLLHNP